MTISIVSIGNKDLITDLSSYTTKLTDVEFEVSITNTNGEDHSITRFYIDSFLYNILKHLIENKQQVEAVANIKIQTLHELIKQLK